MVSPLFFYSRFDRVGLNSLFREEACGARSDSLSIWDMQLAELVDGDDFSCLCSEIHSTLESVCNIVFEDKSRSLTKCEDAGIVF